MKKTLLKKKSIVIKPQFYLGSIALLLFPGLSSANNLIGAANNHPYAVIKAAKQNVVTIKGKVTDQADGQSLPGVSVKVKGTAIATVTDLNGNFTIQADDNAVLVFSYIGYDAAEVSVGGKTSINVSLRSASKNLNEVVVVGYGTQKKTSTTSAVSTLAVKDIAQKPVVNLTNSLVGRVSGIIARQGNGEPGQDASQITIRGAATTGRTGALTIVDGVPRDFSRLDPNSIATLTVLKDAAAVAPYGVAGANGVILITTKQGKSGKPQLTYNGYYGFQNPTIIPKFVDAVQYARLKNEAAVNDAAIGATVNLPYTERDIELYGNGQDPDGHANVQPLEGIIRKNSPMQYHNLTLSGGTDDIKYFASVGYNRQDGMWRTTYVNKFNGSLGLTAKATQSTTVDLKVNGYQEDQHYPAQGAGTIFRQAYRQPPISPVRYSNGLAAAYIGQSLYGEIYDSGYQLNKNNALLTQLSIDQKLPIKGLSVKGIVSYDKGPDPLGFSPVQNTITRKYDKPIAFATVQLPPGVTQYGPGVDYLYPISYQGQAKPLFRQTSSENVMTTYQGILNYNNTFGKSEITGLFVTEYRKVRWQSFYAERVNYDLSFDELDYGGTAPADSRVGGSSGGQKQLGYVYKFIYGYAGKYFAEAAGRYDGSYVFAPGHRFGFFPAFSVAWRLSEEKFIKNNFSWIDNLKLRASYGQVGNYPNGGQYQYLSQFGVNANSAVLGNSTTQGVSENLQGNPAITWERAKKTDVGIEGTFWNGALGIEADYFYEKRSNFLVNQSGVIPSEYGVTLGQVNGGILSNQGVDLTLSTFKQFENGLRLDVRGTFTFAKSKVIQKFENASTFNNPNRRETGRPLGEQFGLISEGYYTIDDFVDPTLKSLTLKPGIPVPNYGAVKPGDIKYADINSASFDGKPDGKVDANDRTDIGNPEVPQIIYSLAPHITYKNFDLDLLFQGTARSNLQLGGFFSFPFNESGSASQAVYLDHWTPSTPNATYPRIQATPSANNTQFSTHWMRNNSYIRLKSAELGYTFSKNLLGKAFSSLRIYTAGQNLFLWTPWMKEKIDPENSGNFQNYFQQKVITFGLNATF
ncbi:SusC/RagA family TonB-linked outer membrane protein [Mucilaginibacter pedocola]|uniref:SusC/RagA family TonB-linked outer membrane protein n=1 Tax=Mucilaginibacter pedocola TaxID=1792845 RepID=A0A1S9PFM3_9SPHI|nr:TonB-dependent receptor [Mucilaginibacter pedocola]OOQ59756.1 SusC/RagA family TonB-linked outer membrane protein [Mucilaginibacter pedocola]